METIGKIIQQQPTTQPSSWKNFENPQIVEAFLADFPTIEQVFGFFTPDNWPTAIKYADLLITRPCIMLAQVDEVYHADGAALQIVVGQFVGLHKLSGSRNEYHPKSAEFSANMFLAKYGEVCTLFDSMIYFGNYPIEYKTTYAQFDAQDVLQQFGNKYLFWKRNRKSQRQEEENEQTQQPTGSDAITHEELVFLWLTEGRTEESIRNGDLYFHKIITEKMIKNARKQLTTNNPF